MSVNCIPMYGALQDKILEPWSLGGAFVPRKFGNIWKHFQLPQLERGLILASSE